MRKYIEPRLDIRPFMNIVLTTEDNQSATASTATYSAKLMNTYMFGQTGMERTTTMKAQNILSFNE